MRREGFFRDRFPDEVTCVRCLEVVDISEVDRLLWCELCQERARARASRRGWIVGAVIAGILAVWIFAFIRPSRDLILGGWIACLVAALWIGSRVGREVFYGMERWGNRKAQEARPPDDPPSPGDRAGPG